MQSVTFFSLIRCQQKQMPGTYKLSISKQDENERRRHVPIQRQHYPDRTTRIGRPGLFFSPFDGHDGAEDQVW